MTLERIVTKRLVLHCWRNADPLAFAAMNSDPDVMDDLGGPIDVVKSNQKFDHYLEALNRFGYARWCVELNGEFIGYCGVMHRPGPHPLGYHDEIGWRFMKSAWGYGYATEAAKAALTDAHKRLRLKNIYAYTGSQNLRSQAVMKRLGLERKFEKDFSHEYEAGNQWRALVWVSRGN